jgi:hypothetical protein
MIARGLGENAFETSTSVGNLGWIFSPQFEFVVAPNGPKNLTKCRANPMNLK